MRFTHHQADIIFKLKYLQGCIYAPETTGLILLEFRDPDLRWQPLRRRTFAALLDKGCLYRTGSGVFIFAP